MPRQIAIASGGRHRWLRIAWHACVLTATLVAVAACARGTEVDAAPAPRAAGSTQAPAPPPTPTLPAHPTPALDAAGGPRAPQAPVIDESAPTPPRLGGIALADATAAAGPMGTARPAIALATPVPVTGGKLDDRCASDADCAIKDVGSCCGYRPQCLNHDSPTDAVAVKARCASEGRVGICGFPAVAGCQCVQGHCAATLQTDEGKVQ